MEYENNQNTGTGTALCMDWNDAIEDDGREFVVLEEGDYNFTVTGFDRGRFPGSARIPACNKALITVTVDAGGDGMVPVKLDLILYRSLEWKLSAFFRCIGRKGHGERMDMDWDSVLGSYGRAHFKPRTYVNRYGEERTANDLDRFLDYEDQFFTNFRPAPVTGSDGMQAPGEADALPFEG